MKDNLTFIAAIALGMFIGAYFGDALKEIELRKECQERYEVSEIQCRILLRGGPMVEEIR